jgi:hypothetical protein
VCQAISPGSIGLSRVSNGAGGQRILCRINTLRSGEGGRTVWQHAARHRSNGERGRSVSEAPSACRWGVIAGRLAGRETLRGVHRRFGGKPGTEGFGSPNLVQTKRTLWSAAGCNKPAGRCAEQTVAVVRNGMDGTCRWLGSCRPRELAPGVDAQCLDDGGAP